MLRHLLNFLWRKFYNRMTWLFSPCTRLWWAGWRFNRQRGYWEKTVWQSDFTPDQMDKCVYAVNSENWLGYKRKQAFVVGMSAGICGHGNGDGWDVRYLLGSNAHFRDPLDVYQEIDFEEHLP